VAIPQREYILFLIEVVDGSLWEEEASSLGILTHRNIINFSFVNFSHYIFNLHIRYLFEIFGMVKTEVFHEV